MKKWFVYIIYLILFMVLRRAVGFEIAVIIILAELRAWVQELK